MNTALELKELKQSSEHSTGTERVKTEYWRQCWNENSGRVNWLLIIDRSCHKHHFAVTSFVVTNTSFVATKVWLPWQNVCCNKIMFVAAKYFLELKCFVATSILLLRQKTCFVITNTCLLWQNWKVSSLRQNFCHIKIFCHDKQLSKLLLWQKMILVAAPANDSCCVSPCPWYTPAPFQWGVPEPRCTWDAAPAAGWHCCQGSLSSLSACTCDTAPARLITARLIRPLCITNVLPYPSRNCIKHEAQSAAHVEWKPNHNQTMNELGRGQGGGIHLVNAWMSKFWKKNDS